MTQRANDSHNLSGQIAFLRLTSKYLSGQLCTHAKGGTPAVTAIAGQDHREVFCKKGLSTMKHAHSPRPRPVRAGSLLRRRAVVGMTSLLALCALPQMALAQNADQPAAASEPDRGVNEIIVTAQRRAESVQNVPIAISAFDETELARRAVVNALDVALFVPNMVGLNNTGLGTANAYYIRGIGSTETIATFDPPVGTYVDDIYLSRQNANNLMLFDVNRLEVLRGPQGTLFGRNTTGGAVSVHLAQPKNEFAGYAEIGYGSYNQVLARAGVNVPLSDSFAASVSGFFMEDDGFARNTITNERTNRNNNWGVRLALRGEMAQWARWNGSYIHTESRSDNVLNFDCNPAQPTQCDGRFSTTGLRRGGNFISPTLGPLMTGRKVGFGNGNTARMDFVSSNFEFDISDDWSINLITGFVNIGQQFAIDFADGRALPSVALPVPPVRGFPFGGFTIANDGRHTQVTQEIKFNGSIADGLIDVVGGVFYFNEDNRTDFADIFTLGSGFPLLLADRTLDNKAEAWAGYLQADLNVTDRLTFTAGIRYTDETKTFAIRDNRNRLPSGLCSAVNQFGPSPCIDTANLVAPNGRPIPTKQTTRLWTPRFAVNYRPNDNILLFASATKGFKSGGWNARGTAPGELLPFGPEEAWSYEVGAKTDLFDRLLRFNVTGFWLDIAELQTPSAFVRPDGSLAFLTGNFADYRNRGVEIDITANPARGLNVFAAIGYQDDEYRIDRNAPPLNPFGFQSVAAQQAACQAQLSAGLIPNATGASVAPACGVGIVTPNGAIATPVRTPDWTVAIGASYEAQLSDKLTLTPSLNGSWRSRSEVGTSNVTLFDRAVTGPTGVVFPSNSQGLGNPINPPTGSLSPARWIINGALTLASTSGWSLVAECRNCLDQEAIESSLANFSYLNPPRTFLLRAKYAF
jgi:iron complex outermembrane receptor protein